MISLIKEILFFITIGLVLIFWTIPFIIVLTLVGVIAGISKSFADALYKLTSKQH